MRILILLLIIIIHQSIFSQTDYPEWERLDYEGFSRSEIMKIEVNSKNQLIGLLPTGVFRSTDLGNNWEKLNTPDSLIYDSNRPFIVKKNIIFLYGHVNYCFENNGLIKSNKYNIISYDYGENWIVCKNLTDNDPKILYSNIMFLDDINNFWGIGIKEDNNGVIYKSLIKAELYFKEFSTSFEFTKASYSNSNLYCQDSTLLYWILKDTVFNKGLTTEKTLSILYVFVSEDYGETWNTINPDGGDIPYYMFEKNYIDLSWLFYYKGIIYFVKGDPNNEEDNSYFAINIKNKKYGYEKLHDFYRRGPLTKLNDSVVIAACGLTYRDPYEFWRSDDRMKTWNKITYNLPGIWYSQIISDSNMNLYTKQDEGIWRLMNGSSEWTLQNKGLQSLSGAHLTVNSKSEIFARFYTIDRYKIYKPEQNQWIDPRIDSCGIEEGPFPYQEYMKNDDLIIASGCGLKRWDTYTGSMDDMMIEDTLKLSRILYRDNNIIYGQSYKYDIKGNLLYYYHAISEDCKTWQINHNYKNPGYYNDYLTVFNKSKDWIVFADSGQIYLSHNKGTDWIKVLNDTANPKLYDSWSDETIDTPDYCSMNTYSGVGYVVYRSYRGSGKIIYFTTDNGYTWSDITDKDSITKMILLQNDWGGFYTQRYDLLPDHSNGYFYACTPRGIYRSTDSLKSFHCISEGKIEPSEIKDVVLGNDGRLYAVNIRGIWRTKTKVINSVEKDGDIVNNDVKIIISPNPATEYITINLSSIYPTLKRGVEGEVVVEIYDVMGVLIHSTPVETKNFSSLQKIDVSNLSPGVYFVKIVGSNGACSIVEKFVKM